MGSRYYPKDASSLAHSLAPGKDLIRRVAAALRWRRLLMSCRLDPDQLPRPVPGPSAADFIICGIPRSGTSLLAALLTQPPRSLVCMEPWDGLRLPPRELFASIRSEVESSNSLGRGRLDLVALARGEVRWHRDGAVTYPVRLEPGYRLGVKWPGFWRYLDLLPRTRFLVCVRHPADVLRSFEETGGRLAAGLEYDVAFHRRMNRELVGLTSDVTVRRAALYEYISSRIVPHLDAENVLLVHYERWGKAPEELLGEISQFLGLEPPLALSVNVQARRASNAGNEALIRRRCPSATAFGYHL